MKIYLKWYQALVKKNKSKVISKSIKNCKNWLINNNVIKHKSNLFFKIIGLEVLKPY